MNALELKIPPLLLVIIFGGAMWAVSRILPAGYLTIPGKLWLSAAVLAVGGMHCSAGGSGVQER